MIFDKGSQATMQWSQDSLFNEWCFNNPISTCKNDLDTAYILDKINLKWITGLNVEDKTVKTLEDKIGQNLYDFGNGDDFIDSTSKPWFMK